MGTEGSVTHWIGQLQGGEQGAAHQELWNRYFERLVALARQKLRGLPQRDADEEDVVLSALDCFFVRTKRGQFPQLRDRTNLWPLLVKITAGKAVNQLRRQRAAKRGGGQVRGESVFAKAVPTNGEAGIEQVAGSVPTPEFAAEMTEQTQRLLDRLDDASFRTVANMKLQGYLNAEIAQHLEVSESTIERKLRQIRKQWSDVLVS